MFVCSYLVFGRSCSIVNLLEQSARPGTILASLDAACALPECSWSSTNISAQNTTTFRNNGLLESFEVEVRGNSDENVMFCPLESKEGTEMPKEHSPLVEDGNIRCDDMFDDHDKNPDEALILSKVFSCYIDFCRMLQLEAASSCCCYPLSTMACNTTL
jgi:hypothetical protein